MKIKLLTTLLVFSGMLLGLGGCARGPMFITMTEPSTKHHGWEISAGPDNKINISRILAGAGRATIPRPEPQSGWFVAIINENELWYFDGDESLSLFYRRAEVTTTYNHDNAPIPVPAVVVDALPPNQRLRKMPNKAVGSTATRFTPPAEQESRHGQP